MRGLRTEPPTGTISWTFYSSILDLLGRLERRAKDVLAKLLKVSMRGDVWQLMASKSEFISIAVCIAKERTCLVHSKAMQRRRSARE